jgi:hypothetical protein
MKPQIELMLDSGAYTCFTAGKNISVDDYISFILKNQQHIKHVINLDVIAPSDPEVAAAAGRLNFLKIRDAGIPNLPVYHARERLHWLDLMLEDCPYLGLSGTSLVSPREDKQWHDLVWGYITDSKGFPIVKTHSFGNTSERALLTFPWSSADSATWMISGCRAGRVKLQGKTFQLRTYKVSDSNFISNGDSGLKRESWEKEITALGLNPEKLMNIIVPPKKVKGVKADPGLLCPNCGEVHPATTLPMLRSYLHAAELLKLKELSSSCTRFKAASALLSFKKQLTGGIERKGTVRTVLVIAPATYYFNFPVLYALGVKDILVSYYYITASEGNFWEEKMIPYMYDPVGFMEKDEKTKKMWNILNEVLLKPVTA